MPQNIPPLHRSQWIYLFWFFKGRFMKRWLSMITVYYDFSCYSSLFGLFDYSIGYFFHKFGGGTNYLTNWESSSSIDPSRSVLSEYWVTGGSLWIFAHSSFWSLWRIVGIFLQNIGFIPNHQFFIILGMNISSSNHDFNEMNDIQNNVIIWSPLWSWILHGACW